VADYERRKTKKRRVPVKRKQNTYRPTQAMLVDEVSHGDWRAGDLQLAASKSKFGLDELNTFGDGSTEFSKAVFEQVLFMRGEFAEG